MLPPLVKGGDGSRRITRHEVVASLLRSLLHFRTNLPQNQAGAGSKGKSKGKKLLRCS